MNILEIVEENAVRRNAAVVHEIELDIGVLAGVEFPALEFAVEHAPKSELLRNVKFVIHKIKALAHCMDCRHVFETDEYGSPCPRCHSVKTEITKGHEMKVRSFKMD